MGGVDFDLRIEGGKGVYAKRWEGWIGAGRASAGGEGGANSFRGGGGGAKFPLSFGPISTGGPDISSSTSTYGVTQESRVGN